jgi:hypothetical protein
MYPSPVAQQASQYIPQTSNQNIRPPLPPPPNSSSTPHYPQYNNISNSPASGHPGQPPLYPQAMPYTMGGSTASASNQQNNNLNGPLSVRMNL